ncbi:MAG TPA: hypothetical protein VGQ82_11635, partial [Chthoniobacterales bacterium]|nr:hypothetical protein [Chthoniobacterales bacterium]
MNLQTPARRRPRNRKRWNFAIRSNKPGATATNIRRKKNANREKLAMLMSAVRKYLEVLLFVALWMALGWAFHLVANAYLLLGVPLLVFFQLGLRRQPLRKLWVRDAASLRLDWIGLPLAVLLMIVP